MKKISAIALAALAVTAAQAVQIAWEIENVKYPTIGTDVSASDTSIVAYLYDATTYSEADIVNAVTGVGGAKASDLSNVFNVARPNDTAYLAAGKANDDNYAANTTYSFFAVIYDSATIDSASNYMVLDATKKTKGSGQTTVSFDAANGSWAPTQSVPEPTTVALLALGLAAVGLKRKVA